MTLDIDHRDDCTNRNEQLEMGRFGDKLLRCWSCGRFSVVTLDPAHAVVVAAEAPVWFVARHVCVDRLAPVTWQGRGCRECAQARRDWGKSVRRDR